MTSEKIKQKVFEIAELLFSSQEMVISRVEFLNHLGSDFEEYGDLIREALCSNRKIVPNKQGRIGGIKFAEEKYRRSVLSQGDKSALSQKVDQLWSEYLEQSEKVKREKPEQDVEKAFHKWLESLDKLHNTFPEPNIVSFRSRARRGKKWKNVDGYYIRWETHKYFISFKPIFTTFEVKATLPKADGIGQAKYYLDFSHYVYLVFRYESGSESLKNDLKRNGYSELDGVGIIYTSDGVNFEILYKSAPNRQPHDKVVEEHLDLLLSETDKEKLLEIRHQYMVGQVLIPAISL